MKMLAQSICMMRLMRYGGGFVAHHTLPDGKTVATKEKLVMVSWKNMSDTAYMVYKTSAVSVMNSRMGVTSTKCLVWDQLGRVDVVDIVKLKRGIPVNTIAVHTDHPPVRYIHKDALSLYHGCRASFLKHQGPN